MKILTMSHQDLTNQLVYGKLPDKHLLIVVQDEHPHSVLTNVHLIDRMDIAFEDVEDIDLEHKIFTSDNARDILNFVNNKLDRVQAIVVACKDGYNRSTAIAGALSKIINYKDEITNKSVFNSLVYLTILDEYLANTQSFRIYSAIEYARRLNAKQLLPLIEYKTLIHKTEHRESKEGEIE